MYSSIISEKKVDCRSAIQPPVSSCAPSKSASLLIYLIALIALCIPSNGLSHPLGNFSINRYSRLEPGAGYLNVYYVVDMAEIPTLQEKKRSIRKRVRNDPKYFKWTPASVCAVFLDFAPTNVKW
jgi:hypothetical protein